MKELRPCCLPDGVTAAGADSSAVPGRVGVLLSVVGSCSEEVGGGGVWPSGPMAALDGRFLGWCGDTAGFGDGSPWPAASCASAACPATCTGGGRCLAWKRERRRPSFGECGEATDGLDGSKGCWAWG